MADSSAAVVKRQPEAEQPALGGRVELAAGAELVRDPCFVEAVELPRPVDNFDEAEKPRLGGRLPRGSGALEATDPDW